MTEFKAKEDDVAWFTAEHDRLQDSFFEAMKKFKEDNSKVNQDAMKEANKLEVDAYLKMTSAQAELEELKQKLPHDGVLSAFLTNCAKSLDFVTFGSLDYRKLMPVLVGLRDATTKGTRVFCTLFAVLLIYLHI